MQDVESAYQPLERLEEMRKQAEALEELRQNQSFQTLFLTNFLGNRYHELEKEILRNASQGVEDAEIIFEYRALDFFKRYLERIEEGGKAKFYQRMAEKANKTGWSEEDLDSIRRSLNV